MKDEEVIPLLVQVVESWRLIVPKAAIIYDTKGGSTGKVANAIEEGLKEYGVKVLSKRAATAKIEDVADADIVILGSPTYQGEMTPSMKEFLSEMENVDLKGKVGVAFGSVGWSGESINVMNDSMEHIFGMNVIKPGLKVIRNPSKYTLERCKDFGKEIAERIK